MSGDEMIACLKRRKIGLEKQAPTRVLPHYGARRNEPSFRNPRRRKMTKLRNIVGIAFVAMSLLTGLAVTSAPAQQVTTFRTALRIFAWLWLYV